MFSQQSFSFYNFNFNLKIYFLNILISKFKRNKKKLFENDGEIKLVNDQFLWKSSCF